MSKVNYSQTYLLAQAAHFLQYLAEKDPLYLGPSDHKHYARIKQNHDEAVTKIKASQGVCVGMTLLKIYTLLISRNLPSSLPPHQPHDRAWTKSARTDLAAWSPGKDAKYSVGQKTVITEYLQHVLHAQFFYTQVFSDLITDDKSTPLDAFSIVSTKPSHSPELVCIGGCIGFFSQTELTALLPQFMADDTDRFLLISSHNHIGFLSLNETDPKKIDFFDSNHEDDELVFASFKEAVDYFATHFPDLKPGVLNPTSISVLKDKAKKTSNRCPTLAEVAALCEGGEIHYTSETPGHTGGLTVIHLLRSYYREFPYNAEEYGQYFHNQLLEKTDDDTALMMETAVVGELSSLEVMRKLGIDFNTWDHQGKNMLMYAVIGNQIQFVKDLLTRAVELNLQDRHGFTALTYAVFLGRPTLFELLLTAGADPKKADVNGWTPLFHAVHNNKLEIVSLLLTTSLNLFTLDNSGKTVLDYAIDGNKTKMIALLRPHRFWGVPPLVQAASENNLAVLTKLLTIGMDIEEMDGDNMTALIVATGLGQLKMLPVLLEAGANPLWKDNFDKNALDYAAEQKNTAVLTLLSNCTYHGTPILSWAVTNGDLPLVQQLIAGGALLDKPDEDSATALMIAVAIGSEPMIQTLLDAGANVSAQDVHGKIARDYAHESLSPKILTLITPPKPAQAENPHRFPFTCSAQKDSSFSVTQNYEILVI